MRAFPFDRGPHVLHRARLLGLLVALVLTLAAGAAQAQRQRFPSVVETAQVGPGSTTNPTYAAPGVTTAPTYAAPATGAAPTFAPPTYTPPTGAAPVYSAPAGTATPPGTFAQPGSTILPPGSSQPVGPSPMTYGSSPVATPGPAATLNGNILPPPSWDPYGTPGMQQQPSSLLNQDPYLNPAFQLPAPMAQMQKFLQEVRFDYVFIPGTGGDKKFGISDIELSSTFAVPFLYNQQNPLLITPGFAMYFLSGPISQPPDFADMPAHLYDAYLDTTWRPQVTPYFGGELGFRVGVYSDFEHVDTDSLRFTGEGLGVLTLSPSLRFKAGVIYLDRLRVKLLPAGGFVWTPNPDVRFDILFPNPKIARRLTTWGTTDWWFYGRGEYGGGSWTIDHNHHTERVDYNDFRVALGLEFAGPRGRSGLFEVGLSFERELRYELGDPPRFIPDPSVFLHAGLAF